MERSKQNFKHYDCENRLWFTSDNLAFFEEQNAINHSKRLADKTITSKTNQEVEAELEDLINSNPEDDFEDYFE